MTQYWNLQLSPGRVVNLKRSKLPVPLGQILFRCLYSSALPRRSGLLEVASFLSRARQFGCYLVRRNFTEMKGTVGPLSQYPRSIDCEELYNVNVRLGPFKEGQKRFRT